LAKFFLLRTLRHEQLKSHSQGIFSLMTRIIWFRIRFIAKFLGRLLAPRKQL